MVYSDSLEPYDGIVENSFLRSSLLHLEEICGDKYRLLLFSENRIAVPVNITVDLPTRGVKNDLDIRSEEPVLFVFNLKDYPYSAPTVYTDRIDFPKDSIAHLYIALNGRPPAICYTRGAMAAWYAHKRIQDLVIRIGNWFHDVASGRINEDGDQFDPLRMEGYSAIIAFDYDTVVKKITSKIGIEWRIAIFEYREEKKKKSAAEIFTLSSVIDTVEGIDVAFDEIKVESLKNPNDSSRRILVWGGIFASGNQYVSEDFEINFPTNVGELKNYGQKFGISPKSLDTFLSTVPQLIKSIPVVLAVKRPKQVIGFSGEYEFLCFKVVLDQTPEGINNPVNDGTAVKLMAHSQPLTKNNAKKIAGDDLGVTMPIIVYGCGALGSKVIEHLSRSGSPPTLLVDPDNLSPHNLVRHTLDAKSVGLNKASELAKKMRELFLPEKVTIIGTSSFSDELVETVPDWWVFDFTASTNFMNERVIKSVYKQRFIRGVLSDSGNVSYLLKEGDKGNPRIDDLEVELFYRSVLDHRISSWLRAEQQLASTGSSLLRIGVGCNSETTIMADDTIGLHGAIFSRILKKEIANESTSGKVSFQTFNQHTFSLKSNSWEVGAFDVYKAKNDDRWNIRYASGIIDLMRAMMTDAKGNETGGVFIGIANYKTMTIHVVDLIHTPDSTATSVHFSRRSDGLSEHIFNIKSHSGGQIGYVGEWHTHPVGPEGWSLIDQKQMEEFKPEHDKLVTPLPVFMTVVTKTDIHPYVL
jgi:hypothetical protein